MNVWWRFALGLCLTAAAGAIDAVSFVRFGAVYASFMSGNTVQVGLNAVAVETGLLGSFLTLIGLFVLGGFIGAVLVATAGAWSLPAILTMEASLIGAAMWLEVRQAPVLGATALLSLAMGAQNNLVVMIRGSNAGTTFVTGVVYRFGESATARGTSSSCGSRTACSDATRPAPGSSTSRSGAPSRTVRRSASGRRWSSATGRSRPSPARSALSRPRPSRRRSDARTSDPSRAEPNPPLTMLAQGSRRRVVL